MFPKINIVDKLQRTGGLVLGGVGTAVVNNKLVPMVLPKADAKTTNGISLFIGAFMPEIAAMLDKKLAKNTLVNGVADGMVAVAGVNILAAAAPDLINKITAPATPPIKGVGYLDEAIEGPGDEFTSDGAGEVESGYRVVGAPAEEVRYTM